jgi:hypothetical protein
MNQFRIPEKYSVTEKFSILHWGTMLQAGRSRVRFPMRSLDVFNLANFSSLTLALGSTQPLTELSTRNIPGGLKGGRRVRLTSSQPFVSRFSRKCGMSHNRMGLHSLLQG